MINIRKNAHRPPPRGDLLQLCKGFQTVVRARTSSSAHHHTYYNILTLIRSGYRQSAHAVPVLDLVAVRVVQHVAVARPRDVTDGRAFRYALESGGLAANYSYVF